MKFVSRKIEIIKSILVIFRRFRRSYWARWVGKMGGGKNFISGAAYPIAKRINKIPSTNSSPKDFLRSSLSESISLQPLIVQR